MIKLSQPNSRETEQQEFLLKITKTSTKIAKKKHEGNVTESYERNYDNLVAEKKKKCFIVYSISCYKNWNTTKLKGKQAKF